MVNYIELDVYVSPKQPGSDLLISELAENGFESFVETERGFLAYIQEKEFTDVLVAPINELTTDLGEANFSIKKIPAQNWNATWEKSYDSIIFSTKLCIRAPFHEPNLNVELDVVIQPQQSFGTGHHPTTRLMVGKLLTMSLQGCAVLDMGCGSGVLAILASKLGASHVIGIDIESNAIDNALENTSRNNVVDVSIEQGTEVQIGERKFDFVLANINKNVLMEAMPTYTNAMNRNSHLLLSGFFQTDVDELKLVANKNGLQFISCENDVEWALIHFVK